MSNPLHIAHDLRTPVGTAPARQQVLRGALIALSYAAAVLAVICRPANFPLSPWLTAAVAGFVTSVIVYWPLRRFAPSRFTAWFSVWCIQQAVAYCIIGYILTR